MRGTRTKKQPWLSLEQRNVNRLTWKRSSGKGYKSFVRNVVVQIPKYDVKPNPNPDPNSYLNPNPIGQVNCPRGKSYGCGHGRG